MAPNADPWRTLGLAPRRDASDEIRRAYRRLAKVNHPDAAGEAALPRFLAIQAAYEQLARAAARAGGSARGRRPADRPSRRRTRASRGAPTRTGRGRRGRADGRRTPGARPGGTGRTTGSAAGRGRPGPARPDAPRPAAIGRRPERRRPAPTGGRRRPVRRAGRSARPAARPNTATPGSTSYEGADEEPFEPGWSGATWYGASSGTYWTINPKEYADPRKHGPEYQARARRAREGWILDDGAPAEAGGAPPLGDDGGPRRSPGPGASRDRRRSGAAVRPDGRAARRGSVRPSRSRRSSPGAPGGGRVVGATGPTANRPRPPDRARRPRRHRGAADASATATRRTGAARSPGDPPPAGRPAPAIRRRAPGGGSDPAPPRRRPSLLDRAAGRRRRLPRPAPAPADDAGRPPRDGAPRLAAARRVRGRRDRRGDRLRPVRRVLPGALVARDVDRPGGDPPAPPARLPAVAAWSAHGAIAALVVGVPSAIVLSAAGGTNVRDASAPVLLAVLAVAYLAGVAYAVVAARRAGLTDLGRPRRRTLGAPAGPIAPRTMSEREPPPRRPGPLERRPGVPPRPAGHGRRRLPGPGRPGRPPARRLDPGRERDVPPARRRRPRPPGRRPRPRPDDAPAGPPPTRSSAATRSSSGC